IILAGGKSSRLGEGKEKALIKIDRSGSESETPKRLIDLVVENVRDSKAEGFLVAISKNTPKTAEYCKSQDYELLETPGKGYHADLRYLLARYPEFVSVACDIAFLKPEHINSIIDFYSHNDLRRGNSTRTSTSTSITGAVPLDIIPPYVVPSYVFEHNGRKLVAVGLNIVTTGRKNLPLVFNDPLLAININTPRDLEVVNAKVKGDARK
ncbi:MAG: NTP transferase domain-containing protein, partial [Euryarchaeota archaeon]|nr:NTP transferase domain-containing protein [Euryarchaeota archaeon]